MTRWYDVVVIGRSLGALTAAALLARRDFQVLVLGNVGRPASYRFEGRVLRRRCFTLLAGSSPAWERILVELAQSQTFRRRATPMSPMFAMLSEGRRVEVPPDVDLFSREVDREFPEVRQVVDELYTTFAHVNASVDDAFEKDAVWPPGTFWERVETGRAAANLPLTGRAAETDLLAKFPAGHPFRDLAAVPALFASNASVPGDQLPALALARLHGGWTRGVSELEGDADEMEEFLIQRIEAHGGVCTLDRRATSIVVKRGAVAGVLEDGEEDPVGTSIVVADCTGEKIADLTGGEGITKAARNEWPHLTAGAGRFVVSVAVASDGLPGPLPKESFFVPARGARPDPRRPVVHVQRVKPRSRGDGAPLDGEALLVAETLLPTRGALTLLEAREAVLSTLREHLPFLDEHLRVVDSPHDGLPLYEIVDGRRRLIDRMHVPESSAGAEPLAWQYSVDPPGFLGVSGEPIRGPVPGTYLVGTTVLPGLGQEGELLAALGAARIITRRDKKRQKMRRQMWSRVETG